MPQVFGHPAYVSPVLGFAKAGFLFKMKKENSKRVSVYIDGANFYYGLKTINKRYSDNFFDFEKFVKEIIGEAELVTIYYYNAPLKENFNKYVYWNQMKLFARLRKIPNCKVILCKRQKRVDVDKQEYYIIKGDDIHLSLDMLRDACKDKYDKAILVSGDGDFAQLVNYVRTEKKEVEIYTFQDLTSVDLINNSNRHIWIDKKMANRFFWREKSEKKQINKPKEKSLPKESKKESPEKT